jgi:hypothetical protein
MTTESRSSGGGTPATRAEGDADVAHRAEEDDRRGYLIGSGGSSIERRIGHDEYDPVGTLALIAIYAVILAVMWVFMYFVEFLGGDLTVVG